MVSTVLFCQVEGTVSDKVRACVRACVCARVCVYHKETNRSVFFLCFADLASQYIYLSN